MTSFTRWSRRVITVASAALAATMLIGCSAPGDTGDATRPAQQERNVQVVRDAFARGVGGEDGFFSILAEDVQWTVAQAVEPTTYTSRSEFLRDGAGPIQSRLSEPIQANVRQLVAEGDVVAAIWEGTATARDGRPYVNTYAWVMTMRDERVVQATAFLDLVALGDFLERVPPA
jgi:ketosteroid isomerase-like protein